MPHEPDAFGPSGEAAGQPRQESAEDAALLDAQALRWEQLRGDREPPGRSPKSLAGRPAAPPLGLANRLDRKARERAERRFAHLMRVDETVLDYDCASLDESPRDRVDFVATERALYVFFARTRDMARIPYEEIVSVFWGGTSLGYRGRFFITTSPGQRLLTTMKRGYRSVGEIVERAVAQRTVIERHVARPAGGGATFVYRPFKEGGEPSWHVKADDGFSFEDPNFNEWAKRTSDSLNGEIEANPIPVRTATPFAKYVPRLATFYLTRRDDGSHSWSWVMERFEEGDTLVAQMECERAITRLEEELGLSLTWPHLGSIQGRLDFEAEGQATVSLNRPQAADVPARPLRSSSRRWLPDPTKRHELRYWTGERWSEQVTDAGVAGIDPLPTPSLGRWAPDPTGRHQWRLWTGSTWAEEVNDDGVVGLDPPVLSPPGHGAESQQVASVRQDASDQAAASTGPRVPTGVRPLRCVEGHENLQAATSCSICRIPLPGGQEASIGDMLDAQDNERVYDLSDFAPAARSALLTELRQRGIEHRWVTTQGGKGVNDLVIPDLAESEADALVERYEPVVES